MQQLIEFFSLIWKLVALLLIGATALWTLVMIAAAVVFAGIVAFYTGSALIDWTRIAIGLPEKKKLTVLEEVHYRNVLREWGIPYEKVMKMTEQELREHMASHDQEVVSYRVGKFVCISLPKLIVFFAFGYAGSKFGNAAFLSVQESYYNYVNWGKSAVLFISLACLIVAMVLQAEAREAQELKWSAVLAFSLATFLFTFAGRPDLQIDYCAKETTAKARKDCYELKRFEDEEISAAEPISWRTTYGGCASNAV